MTTTYPTGGPVQRAFAVLRDEGVASFAFKALSRLGFRRLLLLERPLSEPAPESRCALPLSTRELDPQSAADYLAFRPETTRLGLTERWRSGDTCFVAWHEGRIISACWTNGRRAWSEFLGCEIALTPGDVYMYDAFTLPAHRGLGVAPALCGHQLQALHGQGYRRAIRGTMPENKPALRAHGKAGFRPVAVLVSVKIGTWHKHFRRPLVGPGVGGALPADG